jgi:hypothetical protein
VRGDAVIDIMVGVAGVDVAALETASVG